MNHPEISSAFVEVDDLKVHYRHGGTGQPLVLLHGGLATSQSWGPPLEQVAAAYRVFAPDSRGHGRTNNPSGELSYPLMARDVAGFIEALALDAPLILGYSDGAQVALEMALQPLGGARAFVIGGGVLGPTDSYLEALRGMGFPAAGQVEWDRLPETLGPEFLQFIQQEHAHDSATDYWQTLLRQVSTLWHSVPAYTDEQLAGISTPELVITGDRDESFEHSVRMFRALPQGELAIIPNADHTVVNEDRFWSIVLDFLGRVSEPATPPEP